MIVETESGAYYEIDEERKLVRRTGASGRSERASAAWRQYDTYYLYLDYLVIVWPPGTLLADGRAADNVVDYASTITSRIVEIAR